MVKLRVFQIEKEDVSDVIVVNFCYIKINTIQTNIYMNVANLF